MGDNDALSTLKNLTPVTYNYKVDKEENYVGFIAEDVPDLVAMKDRKSLSPMDILAVLTKVVQTQQKEIEELKAVNETARNENEQLKESLLALNSRLDNFEAMLLAKSTKSNEKLAKLDEVQKTIQ